MSTENVLKIVKERGLVIEIREGRLVITNGANNPAVTDNLLKVLKRHRERIVALLGGGS